MNGDAAESRGGDLQQIRLLLRYPTRLPVKVATKLYGIRGDALFLPLTEKISQGLMKKVFTILLGLQLSACAVYPQSNTLMGYLHLTDRYQIERQRNLTIPFESSIYIPRVGFFGTGDQYSTEEYVHLLNQAAATFRATFRRVEVGRVDENSKQALRSAKQLRCDYALFITPNDWHEGRGLPFLEDSKGKTGIDKIRLAIKLVEVSSGKLIDQADIQGKSGYLSFFGDNPADLAMVPLNQFARRLGAGRRPFVGLD